jgi:hypothetical protein
MWLYIPANSMNGSKQKAAGGGFLLCAQHGRDLGESPPVS